uniref:Uncharacterized protein n=1 Tax=Chromera velia CCMP2878 TaxID=1169474 RepID=A0A0G4H7V9_9ALVE|eukprot:Cvel_25074.t1-p1 / transcript=Cvel_25074.t1 / gene=Cvel_25074 / organism=Chromera_velia_CCMP2878 / gene_product=hypothetical protein / transcript_product=hypothetical protein / location=Cvel_scaffold2791:2246-3493(-) / protein_length=416 / sequence_SO=supercontig / SO=protein_coding / is_pseudo=false
MVLTLTSPPLDLEPSSPPPSGLTFPTQLFVLLLGVAFQYYSYYTDPLTQGKIPASQIPFQRHWDHILRWSRFDFVRDMTKHASSKGSEGDWWSVRTRVEWTDEHKERDPRRYGGEDGHIGEDMSRMHGKSAEEIRQNSQVTRCSSSRFVLTAYFCGLKVARNLDLSVAEEAVKKSGEGGNISDIGVSMWIPGVRSFRTALNQTHALGRPAVFRLGLGGKKNPTPGQSHAWIVVANPDRSFFWLQSYIEHYTLSEWMELSDKKNQRRLSLSDVYAKLDQIEQLGNMTSSSWTPEANRVYKELFNVDWTVARRKHVEEYMAHVGADPAKLVGWTAKQHRLSRFSWNFACEYPVPGRDDLLPRVDESPLGGFELLGGVHGLPWSLSEAAEEGGGQEAGEDFGEFFEYDEEEESEGEQPE